MWRLGPLNLHMRTDVRENQGQEVWALEQSSSFRLCPSCIGWCVFGTVGHKSDCSIVPALEKLV